MKHKEYPSDCCCTQWFPGDVKPVRKGVYEVKPFVADYGEPVRSFAYWDGKKWGLDMTNVFDHGDSTAIRRARLPRTRD